jgi:NADPH:quinone reductase
VQQALFAMYERGAIRPHVMARFPIEQHQQALKLVRERRALGKVVLLMRPE